MHKIDKSSEIYLVAAFALNEIEILKIILYYSED